jgi:hypothetical protein
MASIAERDVVVLREVLHARLAQHLATTHWPSHAAPGTAVTIAACVRPFTESSTPRDDRLAWPLTADPEMS